MAPRSHTHTTETRVKRWARSDAKGLRDNHDDFDYYASLCRCSLCVRVSGLFCCRVRVRVTC